MLKAFIEDRGSDLNAFPDRAVMNDGVDGLQPVGSDRRDLAGAKEEEVAPS